MYTRISFAKKRSPLVLGISLLLMTCGALAAEEDRRMVYARELLGTAGRAAGVDLRVDPALGNPEAFSIAGNPDGRAIISGGGPAGALYGVQQYLADKGRVQKLSEKPNFALRGTVLFWMKWGKSGYDFELSPQEFPWFYDRELLTRYLDYLFENRFNAIFLWSGFIFPSLVELPEYPDARTLGREQLLQNQEQFRWFTNECAKRNISVLMHFYNIHLTRALAQSRNVKMHYSQPAPFAAKFIHYTLLRFLTEFASVGLYVCPGEVLESQYQPEWIRDVILKAAEDSGRHPWVVVRDWTLPAEPFKEKCRYDNLFTELKHNVEMIVSPVPDPRHAVWVDGRHKHIVNVHEAADVKPFRWGSPLFIHEMVKEWQKAGLDGAEVYGRVSWRWPYALDKLAPDQTTLWPAGPKLLTFERDAIWLQAFGRYLWKVDRDPQSEAAWWAERLGMTFGSAKAGELLRQWYDLTGPVLPGVQNLTSVANMNLRPTPVAKEQDIDAVLKTRHSIQDDLNVNQARARTSRAATEQYPSRPVDTFFLERYRKQYNLAALTNRITMPVAEYAGRLAKGQEVTDTMTPDKVVDLLVAMAHESEDLARQAEAAATQNKEEIARYLTDSQAMGLIAGYYGEKVKAALSKQLWQLTGDDRHLADLLQHMDDSLTIYRRLVELTDRTYVAATDLGADWSWHNGLKAAEQDVARQRQFVEQQRTATRPGNLKD